MYAVVANVVPGRQKRVIHGAYPDEAFGNSNYCRCTGKYQLAGDPHAPIQPLARDTCRCTGKIMLDGNQRAQIRPQGDTLTGSAAIAAIQSSRAACELGEPSHSDRIRNNPFVLETVCSPPGHRFSIDVPCEGPRMAHSSVWVALFGSDRGTRAAKPFRT